MEKPSPRPLGDSFYFGRLRPHLETLFLARFQAQAAFAVRNLLLQQGKNHLKRLPLPMDLDRLDAPFEVGQPGILQQPRKFFKGRDRRPQRLENSHDGLRGSLPIIAQAIVVRSFQPVEVGKFVKRRE